MLNTLYEIEEKAEQIMSDTNTLKNQLLDTYTKEFNDFKLRTEEEFAARLAAQQKSLEESYSAQASQLQSTFTKQLQQMDETLLKERTTLIQKIVSDILTTSDFSSMS